MRPTLLAACFCMGGPLTASAQVLDIGGIQLRLGQDVSEALKSLSPYQVQYEDQSEAWLVTGKVGNRFEYLGSLTATDGKVASISKSYRISEDHDDRTAYSHASKDVRRLGGSNCTMREVEFTDDLIHQIETSCGQYRLVYVFPWLYKGDKVSASLSLSVGG
ncbi:MAG: hypothetical protein HY700_12625 [Gemmatimonadetes bacterium]|nr:hypothetical protein [Gemmatimonadota bacterium]